MSQGRARPAGRGAAALGALLVAGHAGLLWYLVSAAAPTLEVTVSAAPARPTLAIEGVVPEALRGEVTRRLDELPPGYPGHRRVTWRAEYRGGHVRSVGVSQLVGPFQDPAAPPCAGRVVIAQQLLDDGAAGPGTLAAVANALLARELGALESLPTGALRSISSLRVWLAELAHHPQDAALFGDELPRSYVRITAELVFERVTVPVVMGVVVSARDGAMHVRLEARARLAFASRVAQWLSDALGGDRLATALARRELAALARVPLAPPPPLPLPGGGELRFLPCADPELREGSHAVLPFAIAVEPIPGRPYHLPPRTPTAPAATDAQLTAGLGGGHGLALELPLDSLNALLYGAWRHGLLDRQLAEAKLVDKLHADPTVATYLSVRLTAPSLTLPPVVTAHRGALRVLAESATSLVDGQLRTPARLWTSFALAPGAAPKLRAELVELELTCEPRPGVLAPCYADLVDAVRGRASDFAEPLSTALGDLIDELFAQRSVSTPEVPAELRVVAAVPSLRVGQRTEDGVLRLTFQAELRATATK